MSKHIFKYHSVPRETFVAVDELIEKHRSKLGSYLEHLFWWNERINLVSRDVSRETVWEHIRHSLLLTQFGTYTNSPLVIDSGTGGGLPGIPLAVVSGDKKFLLNDIVTKKVLAVKQMAQKLGLSHVDTVDGSVAELKITTPFLLVSKHAFKVNDLYHLTSDLPWTGMVFYKGINFKEELEGIVTPLEITVYDLFEENRDSFYKDKALLYISRKQ